MFQIIMDTKSTSGIEMVASVFSDLKLIINITAYYDDKCDGFMGICWSCHHVIETLI